MAYVSRGKEVLEKVTTSVSDLGLIEAQPRLEGRNMIALIIPKKTSA